MNTSKKKPPGLFKWMLRRISASEAKLSITGDIEEEFYQIAAETGKLKAWFWYLRQLLILFPAFIFDSIQWSSMMFKNYLKIALRNIRRHRVYSFINISGLAVGITCCILMLLWVQDEMSYDRFHENANEIYRILSERQSAGEVFHSSQTPNALGPALKERYPEIVNFARFTGGFRGIILKYGDKTFNNDRVGIADPSFFDVFTFPFVMGDPETALNNRYSMVITESMAQKYFGEDNPLGKIIKIQKEDFEVTGVIKNVLLNSHIRFDFIYPLINLTGMWNADLESWTQSRVTTYIQLSESVPGKEVNEKITGIVNEHSQDENTNIYLQPLKRVHHFSKEVGGQGSITYVYIFIAIAFCILLIACINFMNLSTAGSASREKEIGMRKVIGAKRKDIIRQFLGESILLSFIALVLAVLLTSLVLPVFNTLSGKQLTLDFSGNGFIIPGLLIVTLFTGFTAGSYPALFLSAFQPVAIIKGALLRRGKSRSPLRTILVTVQFSITIVLIIVTTFIYSQLRYARNIDMGFDRRNIVVFGAGGKLWSNYDAAKSELLQSPDILSVSRAWPPFGTLQGTEDVSWEGKSDDTKIIVHPYPVYYDFLETYTIEMVLGRFFSRQFSSDQNNYVINESALNTMGINSPIGKRLTFEGNEGVIIGVIKDFHSGPLHNAIKPIVFKIEKNVYISARINPKNTEGALTFLESKYNEYMPGRPFSYNFLDDYLAQSYGSEEKTGTVFRYFTILAIFISCLGLFGMASYVSEQRTKEIGIRKVLGASAAGVVILLSREFTKWVLLANIIAWPIGYYLMSKWLQNFAYSIPVTVWIFVFSGSLALMIALLTVGYQATKAATANPVKSLKYE